MLTYTLQRKLVDGDNLIGQLTLPDYNHVFWTCEDVERPAKIKGITAIPAGTYKLIANQSARFGRTMPLLLGVPNFEGVRIHPGNTNHDTEGCILVGDGYKSGYGIINSRVAYNDFFRHFIDDLMKQDVQLSIFSITN